MNIQSIQTLSKRTLALVAVVVLAGMSLLTVLQSSAGAAQLTTRSATIDKPNVSSTNIGVVFGYTLVTSSNVQSLTYNFCTTALGSCTLPTGLDAKTSTTHVGQTGFPANGTAFTVKNTSSDSGNCLQSTGAGSGASFACYSRTAATAGTGAATHTIAGLTGPTVAGTVYIRIVTYSDTAYATAVDSGVVAVSFNQRLTINARVQEQLSFCIGATTVDNATSSIAADCSGVSGTSVDLGVVDSAAVSVTPVGAGSGGDSNNGVAMVRTNGVNGTVVGYYAVQNTSSGTLKIAGATCGGTISAGDQCFDSSTTQATLTAGTERFGMTIAGINCGSVTNYTCTFASGTYNLVRDAAYDGDGSNTYQTGTANGFAWQTTGAYTQIASSAGSATKTLDDEAMVLKFAATSATTTPTGTYTANVDFVATPTF